MPEGSCWGPDASSVPTPAPRRHVMLVVCAGWSGKGELGDGNGCLPLDWGSVICDILSLVKVTSLHEKYTVEFSQAAGMHLLTKDLWCFGSTTDRNPRVGVKVGHCERQPRAFHSHCGVGPRTHRHPHAHETIHSRISSNCRNTLFLMRRSENNRRCGKGGKGEGLHLPTLSTFWNLRPLRSKEPP